MCNCDCVSPDYDDEEGEELYEDDEAIAEVAHLCCECSHLIKIDTKYRHIKGCWDGDWSTYHMCLDCSAVNSSLHKELDACHCLGGLNEELINSDLLSCDEERNWIEQESWLKVVCHHPLKCEVVEPND